MTLTYSFSNKQHQYYCGIFSNKMFIYFYKLWLSVKKDYYFHAHQKAMHIQFINKIIPNGVCDMGGG